MKNDEKKLNCIDEIGIVNSRNVVKTLFVVVLKHEGKLESFFLS